MSAPLELTLLVRRVIPATRERLFEAWTTPEQLRSWWGPAGVRCTDASIDLRVGGRYRIENLLPDGTRLWISGEFEIVTPPEKLVYTWQVDPGSRGKERVTVRFESRGDASTEVIIAHERIADAATRDTHEGGWVGCLDKLALHVASE